MVKEFLDWFKKEAETEAVAEVPTISVDEMFNASMGFGEYNEQAYNGNKFPGGFGYQEDTVIDYWSLRQKSNQLFKSNHYFLGIIDRLVINEINAGLSLEATPQEEILGMAEDSLGDWAEDVENRFDIYGNNKSLSDWKKASTFKSLQRIARREALISGDVLVVLRQNAAGLPALQLIRGDRLQTPFTEQSIPKTHRIIEGVQLDAEDRQVAYWVINDDATFTQIRAKGRRSGRLQAWLYYADDVRQGEVRGMPLLSRILQSLKEIDRYRDSAQRKAVVNSILAMYIKKTEDKMSTLPVSGGAVRKDSVSITDNTSQTPTREFQLAAQIPGVVYEELQQGEEPVGFGSQGTDVNFPVFEAAMIRSIAWSLNIPPEILELSFSNNYSASQAAINEFKMYLDKTRSFIGDNFCKPFQEEWLISSTLKRDVMAAGFLESWRDPNKYLIFGAWVSSDWTGAVKPSTDIKKTAQGNEILVNNCWSTNDRAAREQTGTKFSKNAKKLKRENMLKAAAIRPILELRQEFGSEEVDRLVGSAEENIEVGENNG